MYFSGLSTQMHHSEGTSSVVLSPWEIVRVDIDLHGFLPCGVLSPWAFVPLGFCLTWILSPWAFVPMGFCPPGFLSSWDFVRLDPMGFCPVGFCPRTVLNTKVYWIAFESRSLPGMKCAANSSQSVSSSRVACIKCCQHLSIANLLGLGLRGTMQGALLCVPTAQSPGPIRPVRNAPVLRMYQKAPDAIFCIMCNAIYCSKWGLKVDG